MKHHHVDMVGDVAVLRVKGNLMGGPETEEIGTIVKDELDHKHTKFVIDLSKVEWMNSTGLGILVHSLQTIQGANGTLMLAGTTQKITQLIVITKLDTLFKCDSTVEEALTKF